jgi:serpin B
MNPRIRLSSSKHLLIILILTVLMSGCISGGSMGGSKGKVLKSKTSRVENPKVSAEDLRALVSGNNRYALDYYNAVRVKPGNQFFSPYSISTALAMTYAGADGLTADQMAKTLHFELPQERLHPAFNALDQQLDPVEQKIGKDSPQPFQLDVANSIWGQEEHPFKQEFLDLLAMNYGAGLRMTDFKNDAKNSRREINNWVEDQTQKKIKDLIPQGGVSALTRLVLTNAIYFKADWLYPFENNNTRSLPFTLLDGNQIETPTMSFEESHDLLYFAGGGFQAVELPYAGDQVSMLILLPEAGSLEVFEAALDEKRLDEILNHSQPANLQVLLPKFEFTVEYKLKENLAEMGMPDAFCEGTPDFSGMDEEGNLCIDEVFHKAFVAVDEKGTEAAAASAVVMREVSAPLEQPVLIKVDRPFLFFIRHKPSGTILFMGRLLDPRS